MGHLAHAEGLVVDDHGRFRRGGAEGYIALRAAGLPLHDRHGAHGARHAGVLRRCRGANAAECRKAEAAGSIWGRHHFVSSRLKEVERPGSIGTCRDSGRENLPLSAT